MKKNILNKSIPTFLAIGLLLVGITAGLYLANSQNFFVTKNDPQIVPREVTISNISSTGFTVSWLTETPTEGFILYSETEKLENRSDDQRDNLSGEKGSYLTHYVSAENLKPQTKYLFKIGSNGNKKLFDNKGEYFQIITGPELTDEPPNDIIYGKVVDSDQQPAEGAIVYINLANASHMSSLVGKDSMWAKPLQTGRNTDLNSYISYDSELSLITIKATLGLDQNKNAQILIATKDDSPVPTITLGKNEDYRQEKTAQETTEQLLQNPVSQESSGESSESTTTKANFSSITNLDTNPSQTGSTEVIIKNPAYNGEKVNTLRPQILGSGSAGKVLTVELESSPKYSGTISVDSYGNWQYTPPADLTSGAHKITISWLNDQGQEEKIVRQFVVLAEGESMLPAFEATPSASTKPSPSPSPTPSPSLKPSPSPSNLSPVSPPSTESGLLKPGSIAPTFLVFFFGLGFLIFGFVWQFLYKKGS